MEEEKGEVSLPCDEDKVEGEGEVEGEARTCREICIYDVRK